MDNKEEKTFADLFSSSTEQNEETFSDILKNPKEEQEKTEEKNNMSFKDMFKEISLNTPSEINEIKEPIDENNQEELKVEEPNEQKKELNLNNLFFEETPSSTEEQPKEEIEITNNVEEKVDNPFFVETASPIEEEPKEKIEITNNVEEKVDNPFFEETASPIEEEPKEKIEITTKVEEEVDNPFFVETASPVEEEPKEKIEITTKVEEEVDNPFFEETASTVEKQIEEVEITNKKDETPKSISPFFEEETKPETSNPFFQGQLNLVENKEHDKPLSNIDISKSKHFDVKIVKKKEPLIKFIIGVFSYAIFIFLLLIGIALLVYVLDTKIRASKGDYSTPTFNAYVVLTGSMLPAIEVNDVVVTKKIEASKLNEGDVITFASADSRFQGTIITHRIIKKNPPSGNEGYTFQTRGDNNNVADNALVPESNIYGKVIIKIPKLGYLQEFLASDGGWIIVILIPCLTVISYDIVKLFKGLKRKKYKNIKVQK